VRECIVCMTVNLSAIIGSRRADGYLHHGGKHISGGCRHQHSGWPLSTRYCELCRPHHDREADTNKKRENGETRDYY
jgi:hypothetical protein